VSAPYDLVAVLEEPTLLGVAAILSSVGGLISTVVGVRRSKREEREKAENECFEKLKAVRLEAEEAANELHALKMKHAGD